MRVISGSARGTVLHSIEDISTRPTLDRVKESLFNIIQNDIEDTTVLDLFAGSGAIGIEFLSRRDYRASVHLSAILLSLPALTLSVINQVKLLL